MSRRTRILVVDDDPIARELLRGVLERAGHDVREAGDGRAGLRDLYAAAPDLVILDVEMPELDGWATLERIRDLSDVPVLMLTARETELERVRGLHGGADDYVVKPFGHQELAARVQALLRRAGDRAPAQEIYADSRIEIDVAQRAVRYNERDVRLTPLEFKLLSDVRAQPEPGAQPRPAAGARVGRLARGIARAGEAVRRLPAPQARPRGARVDADRDRARLRLSLPATVLSAAGVATTGRRYSARQSWSSVLTDAAVEVAVQEAYTATTR